MLSIRTILHPTDFSECSEAAFRVACSLARTYGARLLVLHVAPMTTVYGGTMAGVPTDPKIYQHALEERLREIQIPARAEVEFRSHVDGGEEEEPLRPGVATGPEVLVEHRLREGDAAQEILRTAGEVGCDLIVMGTHGRTALGRVLMGSVAEAVMRRADCLVLTIRSPAREASLSPTAAGTAGV
jgi:nucleotide-binding universal stress UspA family protein